MIEVPPVIRATALGVNPDSLVRISVLWQYFVLQPELLPREPRTNDTGFKRERADGSIYAVADINQVSVVVDGDDVR